MKRLVCILLTVVMLAALAAVPAEAKGYTLSIPKTVSPHNLNSYGLKTLNVYRTETPPTLDGEIGKVAVEWDDEGNPTKYSYEYPGGPADSVTLKGETEDGFYSHGLWMTSHGAGNMNSFSGNNDFTGYTSEQDVPTQVDTYLTYDEEYFYFAVVYHHFPAQTSAFLLDTRVNFMQTENICEACSSMAWTRYNLAASATSHTPTNAYAYSASDSVRSGRTIRRIADGRDVTRYLDYYVDKNGTAWGSTSGSAAPYFRAENTYYKIEVLDEKFTDEAGKTRAFWTLTFEGRQPLGDVLRICDVEYEDGTPIDYVPEWGVWGSDLKMFSSATVTGVAPNGTDITIKYGESVFAQTMLPAGGVGWTGANSRVANFEFNNTVSAAVSSSFLGGVSYLINPVHFLGDYQEFDADYFYGSGVDSSSSVATSSTRATRRKNPNLQEFNGASARVIGVATRAASATGDEVIWTIGLIAAMVLCAAGAVAVVLINRKKRETK
ncbi:MAG: hypothetical protein II776_01530 [Clostridia bacterium]|nr:hypothetical protein [Clostridia bacterium]